MNPSDYQEGGTPLAHYEENGPYHCEDCIHRTSMTSNQCIHPFVKADPKMVHRRVYEKDGKTVKYVTVNLKIGCCGFVKQPKGHGEQYLKKEKEHGESRVS